MSKNAKKYISNVKVALDIKADDPQAISKLISAVNDMNRELDNLRKHAEDLPVIFGNGTPQNVVVAKTGTLYVSTDGGSGTTLYVKESENLKKDGWVAK